MKQPKHVFFALLACLIASALLTAGTVYIGDQMLGVRAKEISKLKAEDEALDLQIETGKKIEAELEELSYVNNLISEVLPTKKDQSNLLGQLFAIEEKTGVSISDVTFNGTGASDASIDAALTQTDSLESIGEVRLLPLTTTIDCLSYSQLLNFLQETEQNQRKMQVSSLDITIIEESTDNCAAGNLNVSIVLDVYIKATAAAPTPATAAPTEGS